MIVSKARQCSTVVFFLVHSATTLAQEFPDLVSLSQPIRTDVSAIRSLNFTGSFRNSLPVRCADTEKQRPDGAFLLTADD